MPGVRDVSNDHHREFEPFGGVDAHDLDCPFARIACFAFPRTAVAHTGDVFQKLADADNPAAVRVGQEFRHVERAAFRSGLEQGGAVVGAVEQLLQQQCYRYPSYLRMELADKLHGTRSGVAFCLEWRWDALQLVPQRSTVRLRPEAI